MRRSKRMGVVLKYQTELEKRAARELGIEKQKLNQARQLLFDLQKYRHEYQSKCDLFGRKGMAIDNYRHYILFLEQLGKGIEQQHRIMIEIQKAINFKIKNWSKEHHHNKALESIIDKFRDEEMKILDKREQAEIDTLSAHHIQALRRKKE